MTRARRFSPGRRRASPWALLLLLPFVAARDLATDPVLATGEPTDEYPWIATTASTTAASSPASPPNYERTTSSSPCDEFKNFGQCKGAFDDHMCLWDWESRTCLAVPVDPGGASFFPTASPGGFPGGFPGVVVDANVTDATNATDAPTMAPSEVGTMAPVGGATRGPTERPTMDPTGGPTGGPTDMPSNSPTKSPTLEPTGRPTGRPTKSPTDEPTVGPSESPSVSPTPRPTDSPTETPTWNPTSSHRPTPLIWPSFSPTTSSAPTAGPTSSPTASPSGSPTGSPTESPTSEPTPSPTTATPTVVGPDATAPTTAAPVAPTLPLRRYEVRSSMTLEGVGELDDGGLDAFGKVTEGTIRGAVQKEIGGDGEGLVVEVDVEDQASVSATRALRSVGHSRGLQSSAVRIMFVTTIAFRSTRDDWDADEMVAAGFVPALEREWYLGELRARDPDSFGSASSLTLTVGGTDVISGVTSPATPSDTSDDGSDNTLYYIIGGAVGGGLLLLAGIAFFLRRRKSTSASSSLSSSASPSKPPPQDALALTPKESAPAAVVPSAAHTTASHSQQDYYGTIEAQLGSEDVSTIGDPFFGEGAHVADATVGESMVSSEQQMYEYGVRRPRLDTGGGSTLNTAQPSRYGGNVFADDSTFELGYRNDNDDGASPSAALQRIVVVAPAGKLGIVVDNPTGDLPYVHAIKEASVLKGKLRVGDHLVAVDEVDCRGMSAVTVSKLISNRSKNPARTFVLLRGPGPC